MTREKPILDIRVYEVSVPGAEARSGYFGYVFHRPKSASYATSRIARKLREHGFSLGGRADHLYIDLDATLTPGDIIEPDQSEARVTRVRYGLDRSRFNSLPDEDRDRAIVSATFAVLRHVTPTCNEAIDSTEQAVERFGSDLEIIHKTKATRTYTVTVSFKIRPNGNRSVAFVNYNDHKTGHSFRSQPIELFSHSNIYLLCGSIAVKGGCVILKPYDSVEGQVVSKPYETPIEIPISTMHSA